MKHIAANKFQVIFASAEQALSKEFRDLLKDESSEFRKNLSLLLEICPEMHTTTKMAKMAKFRQQQLGGQCK